MPSSNTFTSVVSDELTPPVVIAVLHRQRKLEDELLATPLTCQQRRLLGRLRAVRRELWAYLPITADRPSALA